MAAWAGLVGEHRRRRRCGVLLAEGTSIRERHRYVTVLVNGDTGEVLAMVPHRNTAALSGFLAGQGHKWCKGVKAVVSDGSKAYKTAIDRRLGHARHVPDRFADIYGSGLIPEFSDTVDTFLAWHAQILDWHRTGRPSNGRIEGTNNLLQVQRRKAHGFTNYTNFEARGLLLS